MRHVEKSLKLFESKFNCAQAVFASFSKELGLDEKQALKIGGCFGSGMRKGEVCGACSGALMVIGLKYGQCEIGDVESNELLNCDLKTEEGIEYAVNNNLFTEVCPKMVESATLIVEDLIRD